MARNSLTRNDRFFLSFFVVNLVWLKALLRLCRKYLRQKRCNSLRIPEDQSMVIGERFAYGHIPKTGGDAVHSWLAQIDGVQVDPLSEARKHQFFWERDIHKDVYILSFRRLP